MASLRPEHRGSDGSTPQRSNVIALRRSHERQEAKRCANVREALMQAQAWCDAGINGSVSLAEATVRADYALTPPMREILRAPLEGDPLDEANPAPWTYVPESELRRSNP